MKTALTLLALSACSLGDEDLAVAEQDATRIELQGQYNSDWLGLTFAVREAAGMVNDDASGLRNR